MAPSGGTPPRCLADAGPRPFVAGSRQPADRETANWHPTPKWIIGEQRTTLILLVQGICVAGGGGHGDGRGTGFPDRSGNLSPVPGVVLVMWEDVYTGQYRRLVTLVTAVAGSRAEAEEAVQEAFVRGLGLTGRRAVVDDPEGWLYRVAVNLIRSRWRHAVRGRRAATRLSSVYEAGLDRSDDRIVLLAALRRLPFEQREALVLHYLADLPLIAIATRVDAPLGTVKARLSRGREALARLLAADVVEGGTRNG